MYDVYLLDRFSFEESTDQLVSAVLDVRDDGAEGGVQGRYVCRASVLAQSHVVKSQSSLI